MEDAINVKINIIYLLILFACQKNQVVYIKKENAHIVTTHSSSLSQPKNVESMAVWNLSLKDVLNVENHSKEIVQEFVRFQIVLQFKTTAVLDVLLATI